MVAQTDALDYVVGIPKDQIHTHPRPENAYLHAFYVRRSLLRRRRRRCLRFLPVLLLLLIAAAFVAGLLLRPRAPRFTVAALTVEPFDPARAFAPAIRADVRVENPNGRAGIAYRCGGAVEAYQKRVRLCRGEWPAFRQDGGNATVVRVGMRGAEVLLGAEGEGEWRRGEVEVEVVVRAPAGVEMRGVRAWWSARVRARCGLRLGVNATGGEARLLGQACGSRFKWF